MMRRLLYVLLLLSVASPAAANYQVHGRFLYRDRAFTLGGFTGADTDEPIRLADVQILDAANNILASGATGLDGRFTIQVFDTVVRNVRVRVLTQAANTPSFAAKVLSATNSAVFAVVGPTYTNHDPSQDIDFAASPVVALQGQGGDAFNIFDQILDAFDFIASMRGSRPTQMLTAYWAIGSTIGTWFNPGSSSIHLVGMSNDSDGYDDTVIIHEVGHYSEYVFSASDSPGGNHSLNSYYDLTLTWSEGYATFFENMVRAWRGDARPEIYVDTAGQPGPGQAFISYEVESPSLGRRGANNEVGVNSALWEIVDGPGTADASPGTDDDPLSIATGAAEFWQVFTQYLPTASTISLEDFWDGWFSPAIANGYQEGMRAAFAARGIQYSPDTFEFDGSRLTARTVVAGGNGLHHTIYGALDEDWVSVAVVGGTPYTFETDSLLSGADTVLDVFAANGSTLLASNDDRGFGDPSSFVPYTPPASGLVYVRCKHATDGHTYGSYDLIVTGTPVPVEVTDVQVEATAEGIWLRWRARGDGRFSHFEIERGAAAAGPWTPMATVQPAASAGHVASFACLDRDAAPGVESFYRIIGVETNGERQAFGPYVAAGLAPARLVLHAPQPNPFNPSTAIAYELPRPALVHVRVFAPSGRLVRTLVDGDQQPAGLHRVTWDGRDAFGAGVGSGIYLVQMDAAGEHRTQRAVLVR